MQHAHFYTSVLAMLLVGSAGSGLGGAGMSGSAGAAAGGGAAGSGAVGASSGAAGASSGMPGAGSGGMSGSGRGGQSTGGAAEWNGIVGTGQSLSTGTPPLTSTTQPYNNLKLSLGGVAVPPWEPGSQAFTMAPLVEPIRALQTGYPSPYAGNIYGETQHSAMANQITSLVRAATASADYVTVHTVVGESGQGMVALKKQTGDTTGMMGRAYAATLFEATAITRLARAAGKSYGITAIVMAHGETDSGSSTYKDELIQFLADSNTDLKAITGQTRNIVMFLSQQFAYPSTVDQRPVATQTQWRLGVERSADFVCTGPKYQYTGNGDGVHLAAPGYQAFGEKTGQVYYERIVLGHDWQPLQPTSVERAGNVITVHFHVPVPPLVWDDALPAPTAWASGRGFEVRQGNTKVAITAVAISRDAVAITCGGTLPASGLTVGYAMTSGGTQMSTASRAYRWGQLRDSDPFMGSTTHTPNPNYAVAFEMPVP